MSHEVIFHIAHESDWRAAIAAGAYTVPSLASEGFIHLSTQPQVLATAGRYYQGVEDLVLLQVDAAKLDAPALRYEVSTGGEEFPHYYDALPLTSVVGVHTFAPRTDGGFDWPAELD